MIITRSAKVSSGYWTTGGVICAFSLIAVQDRSSNVLDRCIRKVVQRQPIIHNPPSHIPAEVLVTKLIIQVRPRSSFTSSLPFPSLSFPFLPLARILVGLLLTKDALAQATRLTKRNNHRAYATAQDGRSWIGMCAQSFSQCSLPLLPTASTLHTPFWHTLLVRNAGHRWCCPAVVHHQGALRGEVAQGGDTPGPFSPIMLWSRCMRPYN